MHCHLLQLPVELTQMIVEELRQDIEAYSNKRDDLEEIQDDDQEEKPYEAIRIYRDLINWGSTCSYFRNLFAPDVYKSVKLVNDEESGMTVNALANSQHCVSLVPLSATFTARKPLFQTLKGSFLAALRRFCAI